MATSSSEYEDRVVERVELLIKELNAGRVVYPKDERFQSHLEQIKIDSNGRPIFSSISPEIRTLAMGVAYFVGRQEALTVSLSWIQTLYFDFLDSMLSEINAHIPDAQCHPEAVADIFRQDPKLASEALSQVEGLKNSIVDLWNDAGFIIESHMNEMRDSSKLVFGGDIAPQNLVGLCSRAALHADTIIIPDPIHKVLSRLHGIVDPSELAYQLLKHGLRMQTLRDLVFADTEFPIVVIGPGDCDADPQPDNFSTHLMQSDWLFQMNTTFGTDFDNFDECMEFISHFESIDEILKAVKTDEFFALDNSDQPLDGRLAKSLEFNQSRLARSVSELTVGRIVCANEIGRYGSANALLIRGQMYGASALIESETSWKYMRAKYSFDCARSQNPEQRALDPRLLTGMTVMKSAAAEALSNVPPELVIRMRETGLHSEFKSILADCYNTAMNDDENWDEAAKHLDDRFQKYLEDVKKWDRQGVALGGVQLPALLGTGAIGIMGILLNNPTLSVLGVVAGMAGVPNLRDLWQEARALAAERRILRASPWSVFMK